ncbi:MAG: hypothetical protein KDB27_20510, partial [Planctomycetales bacterium]|nr:hypothetical protein [Planctomycetales bacterium]
MFRPPTRLLLVLIVLNLQTGCRTAATGTREIVSAVRPAAPTLAATVKPENHPPEPTIQLVSAVQEAADDDPVPPPAVESGEYLALMQAIDLAFDANPDLVSASEQLAIADATLGRARAEFYPKLGVSEQ